MKFLKNEIKEKRGAIFIKHDVSPLHLPSGAGHDAMILGNKVPIAMLFVRSKEGISHNPKEWSTLNDCVMATRILKNFIEQSMEY